MSDPATSWFLPWMRRGLVRSVVGEADAAGVPTGSPGVITAAVKVGSTEVTRSIRVQGPGVVLGLQAGQVVREDPPAGTTDFETNYFPAIELASPDLPWMFTPAAPSGDKLIPWLVLVVVEDRDGVGLVDDGTRPLPVLKIDDASRELPSLREAWAWAHVQSSIDIGGDLEGAFKGRPEAFVSRFLCPRRLTENTWYRACLVPSFKQGRNAGLGLSVDPDDVGLAWDDATGEMELPVYHSWRFRTSKEPGDFESLVKKLKARTLDSSVGMKELDIGEPGSSLLPQSEDAIVGFLGALVSPNVTVPEWQASHREAFQSALHSLLTEVLDRRSEDPVVAPPAYGALAAGIDVVPEPDTAPSGAEPAWLSEANLDPVHRASAGLGAEVIRRNQESLLASAWDQAAGLGEVNRILKRARLACEVGTRLKDRIASWSDGALIQLSRAAHSRIKRADMDKTLHGRLLESELPDGLVSGALRRALRPGTTVARASAATTSRTAVTGSMASSVTEAFITDPSGMLQYAALVVPHGAVLREDEDDRIVEIETAEDLINAIKNGVIGRTSSTLPSGAKVRTLRGRRTTARPGLSVEGRSSVPVVGTPAARARAASVLESVRVVELAPARDIQQVISDLPIAVDEGGEEALSLTEAAVVIREKLDPKSILKLRVRALVKEAPSSAWTEDVPESMWVDPAFPAPTYSLLAKISTDFLLPGIGDVPDNTMALAKVNAAFIESFLLGANLELSREFIWREFPADLTDTWLRVFWDTAGATSEDGTPIEDIARVAEWSSGSLGTHQSGMDPERVLVLLIKGELLRRYPKTLVYAVPAKWQDTDSAGSERVEDTTKPPELPLFVGSLGDDVVFLGFQFDDEIDIDVDIRGTTNRTDEKPGWFFAFEQPPTEPRFGLDVGNAGQAGSKPTDWADVSWFHALGSADASATHAPIAQLDGHTCPYDDNDGSPNRWDETWGLSSKAMARITLQRPVRMLVHADQMLEPEEA